MFILQIYLFRMEIKGNRDDILISGCYLTPHLIGKDRFQLLSLSYSKSRELLVYTYSGDVTLGKPSTNHAYGCSSVKPCDLSYPVIDAPWGK